MLQSLREFFLIPAQFFQTATKLTWFSLGIAVVLGILYFGIIFRKGERIDEEPKPVWLWGSDYQWTKLKLMVFGMICFGSYYLARYQLPRWFPSFFGAE